MDEQRYTIVVGVDGSAASRAALRWAIWQAGLVRGRIIALMAWDAPLIYDWEVPGLEDLATRTAQALRKVVGEVAGDSDIEITREVAHGNAAKALLEASDDSRANLLVVGNRGHGGFTEALLGSVSQHCIHHARCPVLVVRDEH